MCVCLLFIWIPACLAVTKVTPPSSCLLGRASFEMGIHWQITSGQNVAVFRASVYKFYLKAYDLGSYTHTAQIFGGRYYLRALLDCDVVMWCARVAEYHASYVIKHGRMRKQNNIRGMVSHATWKLFIRYEFRW